MMVNKKCIAFFSTVIVGMIAFVAQAITINYNDPLGTYSFKDMSGKVIKLEFANKATDITDSPFGDVYVTISGRKYLARWISNNEIKIDGKPFIFVELLNGTVAKVSFPMGIYGCYGLAITQDGYVYPSRIGAIDNPADKLKLSLISRGSKESGTKPKTEIKQYKLAYEAKGNTLDDIPDLPTNKIDNQYSILDEIEKNKNAVTVTIPDPNRSDIQDIPERGKNTMRVKKSCSDIDPQDFISKGYNEFLGFEIWRCSINENVMKKKGFKKVGMKWTNPSLVSVEKYIDPEDEMNNHIIITFPSTEDAIAFFEKVKALGLQKSKYGNIPDALVTGFSDFDFGVYRDGKEVHMGAY